MSTVTSGLTAVEALTKAKNEAKALGYTVQPYLGKKFLMFDRENFGAGYAADTEELAWEAGLIYISKHPFL
jgi:hypothetical protein